MKRTNKLAVQYAANGDLDKLKSTFQLDKATFLFMYALRNGHIKTADWILSNYNKDNHVTKYINRDQFNRVFESSYKYEFKTLDYLLQHYKSITTESLILKGLSCFPVKGFDIAEKFLKFIDNLYDYNSIEYINDYYMTNKTFTSEIRSNFITYLKLKSRKSKLSKIIYNE